MKNKIMVVDDEPDTVSLVTELLKGEGYDVSSAKDGKDCLQKLKKITPDLILLDIMMPGMKPKEIIAEIAKMKNLSKVKISYFSVVEFPEKEKKDMFKEKMIVGYIQKPFTNDDLLKTIKKMLK